MKKALPWAPVVSEAAAPGLAVAVGLLRQLEALGLEGRLKWPNDLLKDGAKLAGILIETQSAPAGATWTVIGIGMNLLLH